MARGVRSAVERGGVEVEDRMVAVNRENRPKAMLEELSKAAGEVELRFARAAGKAAPGAPWQGDVAAGRLGVGD